MSPRVDGRRQFVSIIKQWSQVDWFQKVEDDWRYMASRSTR